MIDDEFFDCASPEHLVMSLVAVGMLFVYPIGIPMYFAYKLLTVRLNVCGSNSFK